MPYAIAQGNALALDLDDATVDLVVTSPPYFGLRNYEDAGDSYADQIGAEATPSEYVTALLQATKEAVRVLKPRGSLWVNLGDKYATYAGNRSKGREGLQGATDRSRPVVPRKGGLDGGGEVPAKSLMGTPWRYAIRCVDELGLVLRQEIIWAKPNGMPESVTDRARRSHETWFHFTLGPRYYANMDPIREPHTGPPRRPGGGGGYTSGALRGVGERDTNLPEAMQHERGRLPASVWTVATQPLKVPPELGVKHYAAFPMEWPRRIISAWCPPAGVVLDPFGGTGTTALVADVLGRTGISIDASADYCRIAEWRCADPKQRARAARAAK